MNGSGVTLGLVAYRSRPHLDALFASLSRQSVRPARILVCLNGGDDGTRAFLGDRAPEALILEPGGNVGFARGMNLLIARAETAYFLAVNPDVVLADDFIERALAAMCSDPRIAAVGGKTLRPAVGGAPRRIDSAGHRLQPWFRVVDRGAGEIDRGRYDRFEDVVGVCAAAALYERSALLAVAEDGQVFDEDFWMYKEDVDLSFRLREAGRRVVYEPAAVATHARGFAAENRTRVDPRLRRRSFCNHHLLLWKHWSPARDFLRLPLILLFEAAAVLAMMLREPGTLAGLGDALSLRPRMIAKRRARRAALGKG